MRLEDYFTAPVKLAMQVKVELALLLLI